MIARLASIALLATVGFALPAHAADLQQSRAVNTADLDLTTDAGVDQLNGRISRASVSVCGGYPGRDLHEVVSFNRCRAAAIARAKPDVERVVTAARSGGSQTAAVTVKAAATR